MKKTNKPVSLLLVLAMILSFTFMSSAVVFADGATPNADKLVQYLAAQDNKLYFSTKYNPSDVDEALIKESLTKLIERGTPEQIANLNGKVAVISASNTPDSNLWSVTLKETSNSEEVNLTLAVYVEDIVANLHAVYIPGGSFKTAGDLADWGMRTFGSSVIADRLRSNFNWVEPAPGCNGLLVTYYDVPSYGQYETYINFNAPAGAGVSTVLAAGQNAEDIALGGSAVAWAKTDSGMLCEKWLHYTSSPYLGAYMIYFVGDAVNADLKSAPDSLDFKVQGEAAYKTYTVSTIDIGGGSPGIGVIAPANDKTDGEKPDSGNDTPLSQGVFSDTATHWAKDAISELVKKGIFKGVGDGIFAPNAAMTRGMFVTVLGRIANVNAAEFTESKFSDVSTSAYYAPYVAWAVKNGVVSGISESSFAPDSPVTREQMAVMMLAFLKANNKELAEKDIAVNFDDASNISAYAASAVQSAYKIGLLAGKGNNLFDPAGLTTRAEAAKVSQILLGLLQPEASAK